MGSTKCYRINTPRIVNETIDGEVVIINFDTGNYYSSNAIGCEIWSLIEQHQPLKDIVAVIGDRHGGDGQNWEKIIVSFISELEGNGLIVPTAEGATSPPELLAISRESPVPALPELHKFEDMQELLLLDPIHDVDSAGWPTVKSK